MNIRFLLFAVLALMAFTGCEHEAFKPVAGKGGAATLVVYPQHHGQTSTLDSVKVYVKYNTLDAPANGVYDDSANCVYVNSLPSCSFSGLKNGDYYFFARGYDYDISGKVKGGTPYSVTMQQSQNLTLPVGEE